MIRLSKIYGVDEDVLKDMYSDGILNPNFEYYLEVYEHYQEMLLHYGKKYDALAMTAIDYDISEQHLYRIKNLVEGLTRFDEWQRF